MTTVAWFGGIEAITPDMIRRLRDGIGLTALIPDSHMVHHSGYRMPEDLLARSPLATWQKQPGLAAHRRAVGLRSDASPVFPGIVGPRYDDSLLLKVIEQASKLGVEVWAHAGLWGYGGDVFPELALVDECGKTIPEEYGGWGVPICPNNTAVRDWTAECLQYIVTHYDVKELDVDHGHYPPPASITSLLGCCCSWCQARAGALGYDWEPMKAALSGLRQRVASLRPADLKRAMDLSYSFFDFLGFFDCDSALLDWYRFRTRSVTEHMAYLTQAVHNAVGANCPVDSHLFPPSVAFLSGQDFPEWEQAVDRLTPGWGSVVGWGEAQTNTFIVWAEKLGQAMPDVDEAVILRAIYRFFGYDMLNMPGSVTALREGQFPKGKVWALEIRKAGALLSGNKPFFPPYRPIGVSEEDAAEWSEAIKAVGAAGFVTGGELSDETMKVMRAALL